MGMRNAVASLGDTTERRLLARAAAGDNDARRRLIEGHLGIVYALARAYAWRWNVPLEDLIQEGALALVQAVDHYDPGRGMKLSTYATWWVKQAIRRAAMAYARPVKVPERVWDRALDLSRAEQSLRFDLGREIQPRDLTGALGWSDEELEEVRRAVLPAASLEERSDEDTDELGELLPDVGAEDPFEAAARKDARHRLAEALASLPERERRVVSERAGFDGTCRSLVEVGRRLGVSRERARQLESSALRALHRRRKELGLEGLAA